MPYLGFPAYVEKCADVVAKGYEGFALSVTINTGERPYARRNRPIVTRRRRLIRGGTVGRGVGEREAAHE
jgi:hypothetical protein